MGRLQPQAKFLGKSHLHVAAQAQRQSLTRPPLRHCSKACSLGMHCNLGTHCNLEAHCNLAMHCNLGVYCNLGVHWNLGICGADGTVKKVAAKAGNSSRTLLLGQLDASSCRGASEGAERPLPAPVPILAALENPSQATAADSPVSPWQCRRAGRVQGPQPCRPHANRTPWRCKPNQSICCHRTPTIYTS